VVIPSMPGYGFSGKPTTPGWSPERIARAWATLMERLGYQRYAAQGGDWGALIVDMMGVQSPPGLIGIHTNMAGAIPPEIDAAAFAGAAPPPGLDLPVNLFEERNAPATPRSRATATGHLTRDFRPLSPGEVDELSP
jgi:pimeloyl-ACP methyl ester carboxylesterase